MFSSKNNFCQPVDVHYPGVKELARAERAAVMKILIRAMMCLQPEFVLTLDRELQSLAKISKILLTSATSLNLPKRDESSDVHSFRLRATII